MGGGFPSTPNFRGSTYLISSSQLDERVGRKEGEAKETTRDGEEKARVGKIGGEEDMDHPRKAGIKQRTK